MGVVLEIDHFFLNYSSMMTDCQNVKTFYVIFKQKYSAYFPVTNRKLRADKQTNIHFKKPLYKGRA